jgi:hypothetical protein
LTETAVREIRLITYDISRKWDQDLASPHLACGDPNVPNGSKAEATLVAAMGRKRTLEEHLSAIIIKAVAHNLLPCELSAVGLPSLAGGAYGMGDKLYMKARTSSHHGFPQ